MYSTDKEPVDEPREAPKMSVKKKQKKQAKKYDFCYQYPISQHRGYNNASGRVYMNCGKNQYKGAVKIDDTELPEPEYVNAEAIKREQKEMNKVPMIPSIMQLSFALTQKKVQNLQMKMLLI